jgi:hypothetical protein
MRILRKHWAVLLGIAVLVVGPAALLASATSIRFSDVVDQVFPGLKEGVLDTSRALTANEFERIATALGIYVIATALAGVLGAIATLGFSAVVAADYHARTIDLGQALRVCLRRGLSGLIVVVVTTLIVVGIVVVGVSLMSVAVSTLSGGVAERGGPGVFVALLLGVVLVIAVVYLTMRWAMVMPALAIEDLGWRAGLQRSWHLSGDNVWRTFAVYLIAAVLTALLGMLVSQVLALVIVDVVAASVDLDQTIALSVAFALGTVIVAPLAAVLLAVLYFDLRIRRDPPSAIPRSES